MDSLAVFFITFIITGAIMFFLLLFMGLLTPANRAKKKSCPVCSTKNSGLPVDERLVGMFQKADNSGFRMRRGRIGWWSRPHFGRFEKYEVFYKCEVCQYTWSDFYVKKA